MKKIFLFGTALCIAGTAFAFGGILNHGSKSTTYKGGVDAIGVHFAGEKKTADSPVLEPCPEGLEHNSDGSCTVCANGNVYLSYMDDPCGTKTPMNQKCGNSEEDEDPVEACPDWACPCYDEETDYCYPWYWTNNLSLICQNTGAPCKSNADCVKGQEFCNLVSSTGEYEKPNTGICTPLGNSETIVYKDIEFLRSENKFTWWGAQNWCSAQGKIMVSYTDFGITFSGRFCEGDETCPGGEEACKGIIWSEFPQAFKNVGIWLSDNGEWRDFAYNIQLCGFECGESAMVGYGSDDYGRNPPMEYGGHPAVCR